MSQNRGPHFFLAATRLPPNVTSPSSTRWSFTAQEIKNIQKNHYNSKSQLQSPVVLLPSFISGIKLVITLLQNRRWHTLSKSANGDDPMTASVLLIVLLVFQLYLISTIVNKNSFCLSYLRNHKRPLSSRNRR